MIKTPLFFLNFIDETTIQRSIEDIAKYELHVVLNSFQKDKSPNWMVGKHSSFWDYMS